MIVNDVCARIPNETGGFVAPVLKAKFQADAVIVDRFLKKETLMAGTNDIDIYIQSGNAFIGLKEYTKDGKMTLGSICKTTLEKAVSYLPEESKKVVELVEAKCPVFDSVESRNLRALMMVALGCDVYKPGIVRVGAKNLKKEIDKLKEELEECDRENEDMIYEKLFKIVAKKTHIGSRVVDTLVKGIIYEPTNYVSCDSDVLIMATKADHTYFGGSPPNKLPEYLLDFASSETTIERDGSVILLCKGVGEQSHLFLARTSWKRCHGCNGVLCGFCSSEIENRPYCLQCFAVESLVPSTDGGYMDRISTMRMELKHKYRFDGADELPLHDVEQIYDCAIQSKHTAIVREKVAMSTISTIPIPASIA